MGAAQTPGTRWSNAFLDSMRQQTDPAADHVVAELFRAGQVGAVNQLMRALVDNDGLPADSLPPVVLDYLRDSGRLPEWADAALIAAGERVFWRYGPAAIAILHCYSLPYCYAGAKGVKVLALTARLSSNPTRRIIETAQMMVDVLRPGGLGALGTGIRSAQKVRLMHAAVRLLIGQSGLWRAEWDLPVNQEDMAGTLMAFSWTTIDGLRRLGYPVSDPEAEAYLHCWKITGHVLGIREDVLPVDFGDAGALSRRIPERQFAACDEGRLMNDALVKMLQHYLPGDLFDRVPAILMRFFLGDATCDILGVDTVREGRLVMAPVEALARMKGSLIQGSTEIARVHELFGRALIGAIMLAARGGARPPFTIPTELLETWGINWLP
ncbi:MAG: DUF2236 domain-containing protein [Acidobacteria bacterium]|nr:DUF2236 domain-containing protein [Acidobacteriota bacterium]